jgi:hypothetical protein
MLLLLELLLEQLDGLLLGLLDSSLLGFQGFELVEQVVDARSLWRGWRGAHRSRSDWLCGDRRRRESVFGRPQRPQRRQRLLGNGRRDDEDEDAGTERDTLHVKPSWHDRSIQTRLSLPASGVSGQRLSVARVCHWK